MNDIHVFKRCNEKSTMCRLKSIFYFRAIQWRIRKNLFTLVRMAVGDSIYSTRSFPVCSAGAVRWEIFNLYFLIIFSA